MTFKADCFKILVEKDDKMLKKKLVNLRLATFIAISLILGIISAYSFTLQNIVLGVLFTSIFLLFIISFFILFYDKEKLKRNLIFMLIFSLFFAVGLSSFLLLVNDYQSADLKGHYFTVQGKVTKTETTDSGSALILSNVNVNGIVDGELKYKIMLYVFGENSFDIGDCIKFSATLKDKSIIYENSFSPYDLANNIKYTASINASEIEVIGNRPNIFERCNIFIRNTLKSGLDYDEFAVAYGMLTGDAELMDENVITSYRYMGVAHVFAVSGLHIGFLATALNFLLSKLKTKRILKALIISVILLFYSGVCGYTASSIRATIMSAVLLFLSAKGERYDGLSALAIAGIIILLISPVQLFCVGFQLSFVVVIGILLLAKPIERLLVKKLKFMPKKLSSSIGVVLSAQLASIPVSLINFGYFSPISVIANLILIPIIGVVFYLLFILTLLGGILTIPYVTLFIPNYILKFINIVLTSIDSEKLLVTGIVLGGFSIFYYLAMIFPSGIINLKFITKTILTCVVILVFLTGTIFINVAENKYANLYVCGSDTASITVITTEQENVLIVNDLEKIFSVGNLRRLSYKQGIFDIDTVIISGGFDYDMQVFVSRLRQVFNLNQICYFGEQNISLERIIQNSFPNLKAKAFNDSERLPLSSIEAFYIENGLAVDLTLKGKRIIAVSTPDLPADYDLIDVGVDLLIAGQNVEQLNYRLKPNKLISYRASIMFENGESNGNFSYSFK